MSYLDGLEELPHSQSDIDRHYEYGGDAKITARRLYNDLMVEGRYGDENHGVMDINAEVTANVIASGHDRRSVGLDGGSGRPALQEVMNQAGLTGIKVALEPNTGQFENLIHYKLKPGISQHLGRLDLVRDYTMHLPGPGAEIPENIMAIQGTLQNIPFEDNTFDYVTAVQARQHVAPEEQSLVDAEIERVLTPDGTYHEVTTAQRNKELVRRLQPQLAGHLAGVFEKYFGVELEFNFPEPTNAHRTSEDAAAALLDQFEFLFALTQTDTIDFMYPRHHRDRKTQILKSQFLTSRDLYSTPDQCIASGRYFDLALSVMIDGEILACDMSGRPMVDVSSRTFFAASNRPLYLDQMDVSPSGRKYHRIRSLDQFIESLHYPD